MAQAVKRLSTTRVTQVRSLGREDPLEKEMATHSSTIAWKIPKTEEPGRQQSMGLQRVGHARATSLEDKEENYLTSPHHFLTQSPISQFTHFFFFIKKSSCFCQLASLLHLFLCIHSDSSCSILPLNNLHGTLLLPASHVSFGLRQ